jgi:hypothetical protein
MVLRRGGRVSGRRLVRCAPARYVINLVHGSFDQDALEVGSVAGCSICWRRSLIWSFGHSILWPAVELTPFLDFALDIMDTHQELQPHMRTDGRLVS